MRTGLTIAMLSIGVAAAVPAAASVTLLDFDGALACGSGCGNYTPIAQSYGDQPGLLEISYVTRQGPGNTTALGAETPRWWHTGYADLQGVMWAGVGASTGVGEMRFDLLAPGKTLELLSFDTAGWAGTPRPTSFRVYDLGYSLLWSSGPVLAPAASGLTFSFGPQASSSTGLIFQWGEDAYNVGIDNFRFRITDTLTPTPGIPEPGSWALMIAGFGLMGLALRRNRAKAVAGA